MATARDVAIRVTSPITSSERRINPSWTIAQLKAKLEPIVGIPPSNQHYRTGTNSDLFKGYDEDHTTLDRFGLQPLDELFVDDTRPVSQQNLDLRDVSSVPKYMMPPEEYEALPSTVLAWKRENKLGRFDPEAPEADRQKLAAAWDEVEARNITVGARCQVDSRRGSVRFVGAVAEIPGLHRPWVGVALDEPVGKNDGRLGDTAYFQCPPRHGLFVQPGRVEVGDFPPVDIGDEMEEL